MWGTGRGSHDDDGARARRDSLDRHCRLAGQNDLRGDRWRETQRYGHGSLLLGKQPLDKDIWRKHQHSRHSAEEDTAQNRELSVRNKLHRRVVVTLDPELDLVADGLEHSWGRSGLTSGGWGLGADISKNHLNAAFEFPAR